MDHRRRRALAGVAAGLATPWLAAQGSWPQGLRIGAALAGLHIASWNALAAPARTPAHLVQRLNAELKKALASPELKKQLADQSVEARWRTPDDLANLLASEIRRWSDVIARAKIPRQ